MAFDESLTKDVLDHADIVKIISSYINLSKKGRNYVGVCPFHDDTNPSLTVSPEKKMFKCFVCGTGGNAITFVQKYERISFIEALKKVADMSGFHDPRLEKSVSVKKVDEKKEPLYKALTDLTLYYQYALGTNEGAEGLQYLLDRKLDADLQSKYRLGYAFRDGKATIEFLQSKGHSLKTLEDIGITMIVGNARADRNQGRVIFPICDKDGQVIGFSARRLKEEDGAKYVNSPETILFHKSSVLYNYHIAKERARIDGYVYVLEGFMDVFALAKIGIDSAVAIMGTALTKEHIQMLRALNVEVRLCLDGDLPGQKAMMEASKALIKAGVPCRIVDNQGSSSDPDEILNNQGPEALKIYLSELRDRIDFALNYFRRTNPLKTMEEKKQLLTQFIPILINIKARIEFDDYCRKLSAITGFDVETIMEVVDKQRERIALSGGKEPTYLDFNPERKLLRRLDLAERELLYLMTTNVSAVAFYEKNLGTFYGDVYRQIANYLVEYAKDKECIDIIEVVSILEATDLPNKEQLINELTEIAFEKDHSNVCTEELLNNLLASINEEKDKIYEKDLLEQSMQGKSPIEQARILADYNRRKVKKKNK